MSDEHKAAIAAGRIEAVVSVPPTEDANSKLANTGGDRLPQRHS